jgi:site-specific DNA-methyltransferase (adenine-specific)
MIETNKIYNVDCLELMRSLPDKYFDLIITDPPYGIGFDSEKVSMSAGLRIDGSKRKMKSWNNPKPKNYITTDWDSKRIEKEYFDEMLRCSKKCIIFGGQYYADYLFPTNSWIIWNKKVPDGMSLSQVEMGWCSFGGRTVIFNYLWAGYKKEKPEKREHPTQKPVALGRWILNKFAKSNDLIFDPFAGSGSFLIACKQLGFNFIGCEINPEYCDIANRRLSQGTLLDITKLEVKSGCDANDDGIPPNNKSLGILANDL